MKLSCPKCRVKCSISDDKLPAAGAWTRCPKCGERFFIKPGGLIQSLLSESEFPGGAVSGSLKNRGPEAEELLSKMRRLSPRDDLPPLSAEVVILSLVKPPDYRLYTSIAVLASLVLGAAVFFGFRDVGETGAPNPSGLSHPPLESLYSPEDLRKDLLYLRRDNIDRNPFDREINYSGAESRVYKHFVHQMEPLSCGEISQIQLQSSQPSRYLDVLATCLDGRTRGATLHLFWRGGEVEVRFDSSSNRIYSPLLPPKKPAGSAESPAG